MPAWSEAYRCKFNMVDLVQVTSGTASPFSATYNLNSLFAPRLGGVNKVAGFSPLSAMFSQYRVYAAKWRVMYWSTASVNNYWTFYTVFVESAPGLAVPTTIASIENYYSIDKDGGAGLLMAATNNTARPQKFRGYTNMCKVWGDKAPLTDIEFSAGTGQDPNVLIQLRVGLLPYQFGATILDDMVFKVKITYYAIMSDRTEPFNAIA